MALQIGAALSGGGAKGAAHVGVLVALQQQGVTVRAVSGTSAGAIIAGLLACGYDPAAQLELLADFAAHSRRFLDFNLSGALRGVFCGAPVSALLKGDALYKYLYRLCGDRTLRQAQLPLLITAVDIQYGRLIFFTSHAERTCQQLKVARDVVLDDLRIVDAIRASIAIPGVFRPCPLAGSLLVDGGVLDPMPANALYGLGANRVLGVNLGYSGQPLGDVENAVELIAQSISLMGYQLLQNRSFLADAVLNVNAGIGTLQFNRVEQAARAGYRAVMGHLDDLLPALRGERRCQVG